MKRHPRLHNLLALGLLAMGMFSCLPATRGESEAEKKLLPSFQEKQLFTEIRTGLKKFSDPDKKVVEENRKALVATARYMAKRLEIAPYNGDEEPGAPPLKKEPSPTDDRPITKLMREARESMLEVTSVKGATDDQITFMNEYGKALEGELMEVIKNASRPIVRVNAARMLSQTAKMPYVGIADSFVAILKNENELEAVKMCACEGLRECLQHSDRVEPEKLLILDPQKRADIANTLIAYITRVEPKATDPEVARVVQFCRREGVRALGAMRDTVIRDPKKTALSYPGLTLLRVAIGDARISPPPSLSEQVDALVGFCSMRIDGDMDVGVAVKGVHLAMVDLTRKQNVDPENPGRERTLPWKVAGARLNQAMLNWKANADKIPVAQNPKLIFDYTQMIAEATLNRFENDGLAARPDAPRMNQTRVQLETYGKVLFKSDPKSTLELPEASAAAPPVPKKK